MGETLNGWKTLKLGDILDVKHGKNQKEVEVLGGKYPILGTGGEIGRTNVYLYNKPSVLIGRKGTIDKPRYIDNPFWTVDTLFYTNIKAGYDPKWLYYRFCKIPWKKYNEATGVPSLSASTIKSIKIEIPTFDEQKKIASILSTWDKAIELKEKLIEQKKEQKKGLMQKLLTGEERLPGFEGKWQNKKIKDIAQIFLGLTYTPKYVTKGVPFLSVKDLDGDKLNFENVKYISREEFENSTSNAKPKRGDLLFGRVGTLGNPVILNEDTEFCIFVSLGFLRMKNNNFLNYFVKYWMQSDLFIRQIESKVSGSSQKNLNTGWLKEFELILPKIEEQQAIVNILTEADKEINLLEQEQTLLKHQKQGLMQLLLTGKVRVKV
ncbi:restriction endonuclease subunit S [Lysinibacillus sp. FSL H8-0500]|uniref:restriction endonuclease subunit S n=1 Tax=Lysinibacillus sp. FSL H8-0500 TaxID=2921393 RepID=UPI003100BB4D